MATLDPSITQGPSGGPRAPMSQLPFGYMDPRSLPTLATRPTLMHNSVKLPVRPPYHIAIGPSYSPLARPSTPKVYHEGLAPNAWNAIPGGQPIFPMNPLFSPVGPRHSTAPIYYDDYCPPSGYEFARNHVISPTNPTHVTFDPTCNDHHNTCHQEPL